MRPKIALKLLLCVSAVLVLLGGFYMCSPRIMPYHEIYLGMSHEQLPPNVAELFLKSMKIIGALLIGQGVTLAVLALGPFRRREAWAWYLITAVWPLALLTFLVITLQVGRGAPWWLVSTLLILLSVALAIHPPKTQK